MNQLFRLLPLCTLGLGLGLGFAWFGTRPESAASPAASPTGAFSTPSSAPISSATPTAFSAYDVPSSSDPAAFADTRTTEAEPASALSDEARARLFEEIETAYTTYDAAALPKLVPYLRHSDPEVRTYAREGIVQLGHAEGVAPLRAAARSANDPREAAALLEAAEFLELPPAPAVGAGAPAAGPVARQSVPVRGGAHLSAAAGSFRR